MVRLRAVFALSWGVLWLGMSVVTQAQSFKSLYSFTGQNDGGLPSSPLLRDDAGTLYGAAFTSANGFGNGNLFKLSQNGKLTILHAFPGEGGHGKGGANPLGGFIRDAKGDIYDVTEFGGVQNEYGVVFKLSANGKETVLHTFTGPPKDGAIPLSSVLAGASGMFYGTTAFGGTGKCRGGGPLCGAVFAADSAGHYTIIHNFQGPPTDGLEPWGNLVQDAQGNMYGVTMGGGNRRSGIGCNDPTMQFGCGTIFELSPNADGSWSEVILHNFTGAEDGYDPDALTIDAQGNLYGAALFGGSQRCPGGCGTIFKLDTARKFTAIHSFNQERTGMGPYALTLDLAGNLYGSADGGSTACGARLGCGIVFKLDPSGKFTVLHTFNKTDGAGPGYPFFDEKTGTIYSVTKQGGSSNWGTIFQLKP
jgi:uncharacterized repeat protein (TIGR03803 family)